MTNCTTCSNPNAELKCPCSTTYYCGAECQRNDWTNHKNNCSVYHEKQAKKQAEEDAFIKSLRAPIPTFYTNAKDVAKVFDTPQPMVKAWLDQASKIEVYEYIMKSILAFGWDETTKITHFGHLLGSSVHWKKGAPILAYDRPFLDLIGAWNKSINKPSNWERVNSTDCFLDWGEEGDGSSGIESEANKVDQRLKNEENQRLKRRFWDKNKREGECWMEAWWEEDQAILGLITKEKSNYEKGPTPTYRMQGPIPDQIPGFTKTSGGISKRLPA